MERFIQLPSAAVTSPARRENLGLSRRQVLQLAGLVTTAGLAGLPLSGCGSNLTGRSIPVRRDITTAAAKMDIKTYALAITKMKQLPSSDPRNWTNQAMIHLGHCRHESWLFFPWHRAYLFYFEEICRELTGVTTFALPYWNWTTSPQVPAVFWDTSSPLFHSPRGASSTSAASSLSVGSTVVNQMLAETNFLTFAGAATTLNDPSLFGPGYGLIEETPHNYIHGFVGGTMDTFMSPLDPIFWTHHNNIDRLWTEWYLVLNNSLPSIDSAPAWWNTTFTDFYDAKGKPVTIDVETTVLMPLTSIRFG